MRKLVVVCLGLAAAGCGGGEENKQVAPETPDTLPLGTWKSVSEVTSFAPEDKGGKPLLTAKQGDKEEASACVTEADRAKPAPALFAGSGYSCTYSNAYFRGGMINASLRCTHAPHKGDINMSVTGSYDADSFDAEVRTVSFFPGNGDFKMTRTVKGTLTPGSCQAAPAAGEAAGSKAPVKKGG